jgi:hypothetical protein
LTLAALDAVVAVRSCCHWSPVIWSIYWRIVMRFETTLIDVELACMQKRNSSEQLGQCCVRSCAGWRCRLASCSG